MKISKAQYEKLKETTEFKKAAALKYADNTTFLPEETKAGASKGRYLYEDDEEKGVLKRTIVLNTYNWLDSHGDVHLTGTFGKSISERGNKINDSILTFCCSAFSFSNTCMKGKCSHSITIFFFCS